jgi:hypothetical protein
MEIIEFRDIVRSGTQIECTVVFAASSISGTMSAHFEISMDAALGLFGGLAEVFDAMIEESRRKKKAAAPAVPSLDEIAPAAS